jgi:hypothetical protein
MLVQTQTTPEIFFSFFQVEVDLPAMKKQFSAKNFDKCFLNQLTNILND